MSETSDLQCFYQQSGLLQRKALRNDNKKAKNGLLQRKALRNDIELEVDCFSAKRFAMTWGKS